MRRPDRVDLLMVSVTLIWGLNFAIMKDAYTTFRPFAFTAVRFAIAVVVAWIFLRMRGVSLKVERSDLPALFGLGILNHTIYQLFFVAGLSATKAGNAALLGSLSPIFTFLASLLLGHERFSRRVLGGILLSFAGVIAVVVFGSGGVEFGRAVRGDSLILASTLCWGLYTGAATRLTIKYGALRLTFWVLFIGTAALVPLLVPSLLSQDWAAIPPVAWVELAYSIFLSIVYCNLVWSYAIKHIGASGTAVYTNVTTIVALAGAWAVLGERPVTAQLTGVVLILTGVFIVRSRKSMMALFRSSRSSPEPGQ